MNSKSLIEKGQIHVNMESAFAQYETVRHRLPDLLKTGAVRRLPDLDALAEDFDVFLLDAFGVLNIGETAIPGVPERVAGLQKAGKRVLIVSNAAGSPHRLLMEKYKHLGYDFDPDDVITSRKTLLRALPGLKWGVMADESLGREDLAGFDMEFLGGDIDVYDRSEGFVLMGSGNWSNGQQALLEKSLAQNPRPVFVGNPDIVAPREEGFSIEPGSYAHDLADATGITPQFFGKPFENIFELAFERLGTFDPSRTVMVGDSLHTDILGGHAAGIKTALIANYGFFAGSNLDGPIEISGIKPDFILQRP